jgi:hypothetical protein
VTGDWEPEFAGWPKPVTTAARKSNVVNDFIGMAGF